MDSEKEQAQATLALREFEAHEWKSRLWTTAFTLLPLALVATLVTLSVRWVGESQREAESLRVEAASYQQKLAAGDRPASELAAEVLRYQSEIAVRDEQLKAANEKAVRLEQTLANAQAPGDSKQAIDYEAILKQKDEQIATAREEGRAAGTRSAEQVLAQVRASEQRSQARQSELEAQVNNLSGAKDEEAAARQKAERELKNAQDRAEQEVREARDRAAQAEKAAEQAEREAAQAKSEAAQARREAEQAGKCCDSAKGVAGERDDAREQLARCQSNLRECERNQPSDNQLADALKEAATWKERAARCEDGFGKLKDNCAAEVNKLRQENERLRARLRQFEKETPP